MRAWPGCRCRRETSGPRSDGVAEHLAGEELGVVFLEGVGDVFEEDQAEDDVLVFRRVHVVAKLVGHQPELLFKADGGGGVAFGSSFGTGH